MRGTARTEFPVTIVRRRYLRRHAGAVCVCGQLGCRPFTAIARMTPGKAVIVARHIRQMSRPSPINGEFADRFVGLLGRHQAVGHAFNIMSDEVPTLGRDLSADRCGRGRGSADRPHRSDFIAACMPEMTARCWADKSVSAVSTPPRSSASCPTSAPRCPSRKGSGRPSPGSTRRTPARRQVDAEMDAQWTA